MLNSYCTYIKRQKKNYFYINLSVMSWCHIDVKGGLCEDNFIAPQIKKLCCFQYQNDMIHLNKI